MNILLLLFLGATLFSSCEKDVTFDFDRPVKLCLNCILNPDSTITARLTLSRNIENTTTFQPVDDATIVLYENGIELGTLTSGSEGNYYLDYHPESQNEYEIAVLHPDFENLTASTIVPQKPIVDHWPDTLEYSEQGLYYMLDVHYEIHDIPGRTNYWLYGKHTVHGVTYSGGGFFTSSVKALLLTILTGKQILKPNMALCIVIMLEYQMLVMMRVSSGLALMVKQDFLPAFYLPTSTTINI
ncbi:MAG: DUF4249 domain-containing protein [Prolixibacteraceae bacterium]|nr:DUF4249 domain-containing protein [Prolixibacteraceae bacterium]